ncbi:MAG: hypothetical protein FD180_688 [Planctomycetota bacterium]|nr:MAG: hypothetical protein FD180_688 [Planctomycetota bacterium]
MTCPDPETIAQHVEGSLPEFGREALMEHLGSCDACREAVLLLSVETRASERHIPLRRKGFTWGGWIAAAAVLAACGLVWKSLPPRKPAPSNGEGRLTQIFEPKPVEAKPGSVDVKPPAPVDPKPDPPVDPVPQPPTDPGPRPPVEPVPQPPVDPAPKPPADPAPPTRALASIRLLDIQGKLLCDGKAIVDGATASGTLTAPEGAGFRVDGHVLAIAKGVRLTLARDGDALTVDVETGDVYVEPHGTSAVRAVGREAPLAGPSFVNGGYKGVLSVQAASESKRKAWTKLLPVRQTVVFEDFAVAKDGFERATAQGGSIVGARVTLPATVDWSKRLSVRIRVRTAARTVQVGVLFRDRVTPWAAMATTTGDGWRDILVRASDFSAGPTGAASPAEGDDIAGLTFSINTQEPGSSAASLDIDDLALSLEE